MFTKTQAFCAIAGVVVGLTGAVGEAVNATAAMAAPTTVDFNEFQYGDIVTEVATLDQTITFALSDANSINDGLLAYPLSAPGYPGASGIILRPVSAPPTGVFSDFSIDFENAIDYFSFLALDADEAITARAYYQGQLIDSMSGIPSALTPATDRQVRELTFGTVGGGQFYDRIEIDVVEGTPGELDGGPENFDTLVYNLAPVATEVPEPGSLLGLLGLASIGVKSLRRRVD